MASTVNDGKKGSKPKKAANPKKKGGSSKPKKKGKKTSMNLFSKVVIIAFIIFLAIILVLSNIKSCDRGKIEEGGNGIEKREVKKEEGGKSIEEGEVRKEEGGKRKEEKKIEKSVVVKSIEGSWLSTMKGAVLTMKDFEYRIDFSGVDASKPIVGTFTVDDNKVIFNNSQEPCKGEEGIYKVIIENKEIRFTCKKDGCTKRKNTLTAEWEWFEN